MGLEKIHLKELKEKEIPNHVAIIPDGNRRYAEKVGVDFYTAYKKGAEKARKVARWGRKLGIKYLTFYSLSSENLGKRSNEELHFLFQIFEKELQSLIHNEEIHDNEVQVHIVGETEKLPQYLQNIIQRVEMITKDYDNFHITFLIGYSGRREIINAVRELLQRRINPNEVDQELFSSFLWFGHHTLPDPDVVIRTSGEGRLSNFLLFQVAYSELFFTPKLWPEFSFNDLIKIIRDFQEKERRFGR